ncbi:MAG TPA: M20/M25/M40 family metallo-hydrolase [Polyangia bacterium]|nr:M20/M25/M40 family metallo-hydrolase [Polyangia bacterium]
MSPRTPVLVAGLVAGLAVWQVPVTARAARPAPAPAPAVPPATAAGRITGAELTGSQAHTILQSLTDSVGARFAGTPGAERAVEWALAEMRRVGLKNVRRETVKVPRWVRGEAQVEVVAPSPHPLHAVALGGSVGTPAEGLTAEVVEVMSFDELKALGERVRGKIVLFNKPMVRSHGFEGYGTAVPQRSRGAVEAARLGAVAVLVRSIGTGAFRLPHTGALRYDDAVPKIPAAALALEDADLLHRLLAGSTPATGAAPAQTPAQVPVPVKVRLRLGAHMDGEVESANVVGEIPGQGRPEEFVLIGAHLDSWDLATGALDDGAGCAIVLETARLLTQLGLVPRRTLRVVLFMNEEFGLSGARAYAEAHKGELSRHVAAMESDSGAGKPYGITVAGGEATAQMARALMEPLHALGVTELRQADETGADLIPLKGHGIAMLGIAQDVSSYFDWHHTAADTLDKADPFELSLAAAAFAVMAHAVADLPTRLPAPPPATAAATTPPVPPQR